MVKWVSSKFKGVRYWESDVRSIDGKALASGKKKPKSWKPDRCYVIRYQKEGRAVVETVGWESEGVTPQYASNIRGDIVTSLRTGEGAYQSLKEKTALEQERRKREEADKAAEAMDNVPLYVLGDRYIEWAKDEKAASWKADDSRYRNHIKPILGSVPVKDIATLTLEKFKKELSKKKTKAGKPLSQKSIHHCLALIRQMYNKAAGWGIYRGHNPVTETAKVHKQFLKIPDNRRLRFLSREEADKLLTYLKGKNIQLHDITLMGLYAGLRADEIFSILWLDVDLEHGIINIKDPKGVINRVAYITAPLKEMLVSRKKEESNRNALVFKNRKGKKVRGVSNEFGRTIEKLKFNEGVTDPRDRVVFHTTRHSFASWSAMAGTHLGTLQKLMGHRTIEMTLRYAKFSPSHEREAVERMVQEEPKKITPIKKRGRNIKKK